MCCAPNWTKVNDCIRSGDPELNSNDLNLTAGEYKSLVCSLRLLVTISRPTCLMAPGWAWAPGCSAWPCWLLLGRGLPSLLRPPASAMSTPLSSLSVWPLSESWDRVAPAWDICHCVSLSGRIHSNWSICCGINEPRATGRIYVGDWSLCHCHISGIPFYFSKCLTCYDEVLI